MSRGWWYLLAGLAIFAIFTVYYVSGLETHSSAVQIIRYQEDYRPYLVDPTYHVICYRASGGSRTELGWAGCVRLELEEYLMFMAAHQRYDCEPQLSGVEECK